MRSCTVCCALAVLLAACGGGEHALPGVVAPTSPPIKQPTAADLVPVGPTSFTGLPGGTTLLQVRALRPDGGPANGVTVVFKVQAGGGSVQPVITSSDDEGIASAQWTFGPDAAVNLATAVGTLAPAPVSYTVSTFPSGTGGTP